MFSPPTPQPKPLDLLLFLSPAVYGFPSPAQDYITWVGSVRASGDSIIPKKLSQTLGIHNEKSDLSL